MSKFFVHQRIKKVRGDVCIGLEATIAQMWHHDPFYDLGIVIDRTVELTHEGISYYIPAGVVVGARREDWEPAIGPEDQTNNETKRIEETV